MSNKQKIYRVRTLGGLTQPMTKEEAYQILSVMPGELVSDRPGWGGCWVIILATFLALFLTWWVLG